ncbi:MAG: hypothetical protein PHV62_05900 [Sulfuricurvum sp.]|nr:hypothetical protein [Sulfuricurvum sp.]
MCKIDGLIVMPYLDNKKVMFCVIDPNRMKSDGSMGVTLRSDFHSVKEGAEWIKQNLEVNNTTVDTLSCPLIEAIKKGAMYAA